MSEIFIDKNNFNKYFFDIRTHACQPGQIMACFKAICSLVKGDEKKFMIKTLQRPDSARSVVNMMTKIFNADRESSLKIPVEIAKDLLEMSDEEVLEKSYEYTGVFYFYTTPECVPQDDPHWQIVEILDSKAYIKAECLTQIPSEGS